MRKVASSLKGKFNPYHDALGRFTSGPGGGGGGALGSDSGGGFDGFAGPAKPRKLGDEPYVSVSKVGGGG